MKRLRELDIKDTYSEYGDNIDFLNFYHEGDDSLFKRYINISEVMNLERSRHFSFTFYQGTWKAEAFRFTIIG